MTIYIDRAAAQECGILSALNSGLTHRDDDKIDFIRRALYLGYSQRDVAMIWLQRGNSTYAGLIKSSDFLGIGDEELVVYG